MSRLEGLHEVLRNLNRELRQYEGRTKKGLYRAAIPIRRKAMKLTPIVTGNLRASAYTITSWSGTRQGKSASFSGDESGEMNSNHQTKLSERSSVLQGVSEPTVEIGFTALYAVIVHENPRAGNTGGRSPSGRKYPEGSYSEVGQWKFLEEGVKQGSSEALKIIAEEAKRR